MSQGDLTEPESAATAGSVKPRAGWAAYSAAIGFGSALLVIVIMPLCMLVYCATEHLGSLAIVGSLLVTFGLPATPVLIPLLLRLLVVGYVERNYRPTTQQSQQVGNVGCILYLVHMPLIWVIYLMIGFGKWPCYGW